VSGECSNNADCDEWCKTNGGGEKCYCSINAEVTDNDSACWKNFTSQCSVATSPSDDTDEYMISGGYMNWWSAVNFCKAHNKSLVSLSDLGITGGYQDDGYCGGSECTGTFTWSDLQDKLLNGDFWVTDAVSCDSDTLECTSGTNNNSCNAFLVHIGNYSYIDFLNRHNSDYYALCQ
jgi:hypothetical protein